VPDLTVDEVQARRGEFLVLDVRTDKEWTAGHIEGAHHCELTRVLREADAIPYDKPIGVICHSGNRSSLIASVLAKKKGWHTFNVRGGMQEWILAGYPVVH
jgi:hydroxyacylglutathione hydrolase